MASLWSLKAPRRVLIAHDPQRAKFGQNGERRWVKRGPHWSATVVPIPPAYGVIRPSRWAPGYDLIISPPSLDKVQRRPCALGLADGWQVRLGGHFNRETARALVSSV